MTAQPWVDSALDTRLDLDEDFEESGLRLPALDMGPRGVDDKPGRVAAMRWLDDLLERLERTNLAELRHPPSSVIRDLVQAGLRNPFAFSVPQLIEIVFNTQEPLMHSNQDGYSLL